MRIAIIGSGNVGGTLGRRWAASGHQVIFGVRRVEDGAAAVKGGDALPSGASLASPLAAVEASEVVVLATPSAAVEDVLNTVGDALAGKVLIDATNPVGPGIRLRTGPAGESGAEQVQARVPAARVVKAFNTTGYANMRDPIYGDAATVMFVAGDDPDARKMACGLSDDLGFDTIDAGPLVRARELEHLAILWISLSVGGHGRDIAFRLVRR